MTTDAVRVLPSSRPASRTWAGTAERRPTVPAEPQTAAPRSADPARRAGRVSRAGRSWAAPAPDDLPDVARWCGWFALALGEAVLGRRPASQLTGWVDPAVLAGVHRRQRLSPVEHAGPRAVLLSGRVQQPAGRTAEACAVLRAGPRLLVLAFRLEGLDGQWVCTALEAGVAPPRRRRRSAP